MMPGKNVGLCLTIAATVAAASFNTVSAQEARASGPASAAGAATDTTGELQEVLVTAERHVETVQKTSLDIQVVGAEQLERAGVTQAQDLNQLVPAVQIVQGANMAQTFVRGVGDFSATAGGQSAVAYSVDGVYIADLAAVQPLFYDVSRVEILKGPQGTLYGRNSSAGAINILTNQPTSKFDTGVSVDLGNFNSERVTGFVNLPLTDWASTRIAYNALSHDGYLSDGTEDDKQRAVRWELLLNPSDRLSALITADYEDRGGLGPGVVLVPQQPGTGTWTGAVNAINNQALLAHLDVPPALAFTPGAGLPPVSNTGLLSDSYRENTQKNVSLEINYDTGFGTATLLSSYRTAQEYLGSYQPGLPDIDVEAPRQNSHELRFSHQADRWQAVAGLYYFDQTIQARNIAYILNVPGNIIDARNGFRTQGYSAFGQGTVTLLDGLRLIAGLRWSEDDKSNGGTRSYVGLPATSYSNSATFSKTTYRAGLEYDLAPASMLYATASEGFKSGGFNTFAPTATQNNTFEPEVLKSYTLGIKNRLLHNTLQLNAEGFVWNLSDSQQTHFGYDPTGQLQFLTYNAASAKIYGADIDVQYQPLVSDRLSLALSLLHTKFENFEYSIPTAVYAPGSTGCAVAAGAPGFTDINCSGFPLPRAPKFSGAGGYEHIFSLGSHGSVSAAYDLNFATNRYLAIDYIPVEQAASYFRHNLSATYLTADEHFRVGVYVNNLTDERVLIGGIQQAFAPGFFYSGIDPPRTYGVRLGYRY